MKVALVLPLLSLAAAAGCVRQGAFHCTDDTQCTLGTTQGQCDTAAGACAFPDDTCGLGFRYGEQAGALSNQCVNGDGTIAIGGSITGLADTGLVLENNGGDDLFVIADGEFRFATELPTGATYAVTVVAEPPSQNCKLVDATGTAGAFDVDDIAVTCKTDPGVLCGTEFCPVPGQLCCVKSGVPTCAGGCNGAGNVPIRCDDHKDCVVLGQAMGVCCGNLDASQKVTATFCTSATLCTRPAHAYFCDPTAVIPCPDGGTCTATSDPFPGYFRCL
jgi:hypothetical protein